MALSTFRTGIFLLALVAAESGALHNFNQTVIAATPAAETSEQDEDKEGDPEKQKVKALLEEEDFKGLEDFMGRLRKDDSRTSSGYSRLSISYSGIGIVLREMEQRKGGTDVVRKFMEKWEKATGDSVTRRISYASFLINAGWRARGSGYANTVRPEEWQEFEKLLKEAFEHLSVALDSETYDPHATSEMLRMGMAAGMPKEVAYELVDQCTARYPGYYEVYKSMTVYLLPRWQGEPGEVEAFIKGLRDKMPEKHKHVTVARTVESLYGYLGRKLFVDTKLTYDDVKASLEAAARTYPEGNLAKRRYVMIAALGDDLELAKNLYEQTSGTWTAANVKSHFSNEVAHEEFRSWLDGKGPNPYVPTPLELAIEAGDIDGVKAALEAGADVNQRLSYGSRPLISAISDDYPEIAKLLLEKGADIKLTTRSGYTVAASTADSDNAEMLQYLMDKGFKVTDPVTATNWNIIHNAAFKNAPKVLKLALAQPGAAVDARLKDGRTALFLAAEKNATGCVKILIESGADVNARNEKSLTPLHYAAHTGAVESLKYLHAKGADPKASSSKGQTPLMAAEAAHKQATMDLLKQALKK